MSKQGHNERGQLGGVIDLSLSLSLCGHDGWCISSYLGSYIDTDYGNQTKQRTQQGPELF